jgi:hypothetical protein
MRGSSGRGTPGWMGTQEWLSRHRGVAGRKGVAVLSRQLRPLPADGLPDWGRVGAYGAARGPADAEMAPAWLATLAAADPGWIGTPGLAGVAGTW